MFTSGMAITSVQDAIAQIRNAEDCRAFGRVLYGLRDFLKNLEIDSKCLLELEQRAYYPVNEYSDRETKTNLDAARKRVIDYLEQLMDNTSREDQLLSILDNYYLFWRAFWNGRLTKVEVFRRISWHASRFKMNMMFSICCMRT